MISDILRTFRVNGDGRIVLVVTGGLGDTILFSPVFRGARRAMPQAEVKLVTASPLVQELYSSAPEIDRIEIIDTNRKLSPALYLRLWRCGARCRRGNGTDIMVCASRLSPWLIRLFKVVCRPRNFISPPLPVDQLNDLEVNVALARRLAPDISTKDAFAPVTAEASARVQAMLRHKYGITDASLLIVIYPSVVKKHHPRWDLQRLARVSAKISGLIKGRIAVVGGAREGREWRAAFGNSGGIVNLAGQLTVPETAALLAQARLAICNDGGIMHLAGAVGCPMVAIMPGVSRYHRPPGEFVRVITPPLIAGSAGGIDCISEEAVNKAAAELVDATDGSKKIIK